MSHELLLEIRDNLSRFVDGKLSLHEFEDWFVPVLWDLAESDDGESRSLAGAVSNLIAEYSDGLRSETSLRRELEKNIRPFALGSDKIDIRRDPAASPDLGAWVKKAPLNFSFRPKVAA